MLKLYGIALSPFARKALLALDHKGLDYENIPTMPGDDTPEFRAISPLGKIPVLEHDGFTVPDTSVICRYLERIAPDKHLYPQDAQLEAQACWLEEYADSRLVEACAGLFRERLLKPQMLNEPTDEAAVAHILDVALPDCLTYLETVVPASGYLVGDALSIADIAVTTCFLQSRYAGYEVDADRFPNTSRYVRQASEHPLVVARMAEEAKAMPPGMSNTSTS